MALTPQNSIGFSAEQIFQVRSVASRAIQRHSQSIERIAEAVSELDAALRMSLTERTADDNHAAVVTAKRLVALLESEVMGV